MTTPEGQAATSDVRVVSPRENEVRGKLPSNFVFPRHVGGDFTMLYSTLFVDDALWFVELESILRCLRASQAILSDSFVCLVLAKPESPPICSRTDHVVGHTHGDDDWMVD